MRKKAIVTGASRGIGRGIIRELAAAGYDIAFSYRTREDEAKEAAEEIRNMGSFAWYAKADMAQAGEGEKFFDQAVRKLGGLDLLVNNAGVTVFQSILDLEMEETQKMLNLDLLNYLVLSQKPSSSVLPSAFISSGVRIQIAPGATQFTRIPYGARSSAIDCEARFTAAFMPP